MVHDKLRQHVFPFCRDGSPSDVKSTTLSIICFRYVISHTPPILYSTTPDKLKSYWSTRSDSSTENSGLSFFTPSTDKSIEPVFVGLSLLAATFPVTGQQVPHCTWNSFSQTHGTTIGTQSSDDVTRSVPCHP